MRKDCHASGKERPSLGLRAVPEDSDALSLSRPIGDRRKSGNSTVCVRFGQSCSDAVRTLFGPSPSPSRLGFRVGRQVLRAGITQWASGRGVARPTRSLCRSSGYEALAGRREARPGEKLGCERLGKEKDAGRLSGAAGTARSGARTCAAPSGAQSFAADDRVERRDMSGLWPAPACVGVHAGDDQMMARRRSPARAMPQLHSNLD